MKMFHLTSYDALGIALFANLSTRLVGELTRFAGAFPANLSS